MCQWVVSGAELTRQAAYRQAATLEKTEEKLRHRQKQVVMRPGGKTGSRMGNNNNFRRWNLV